LGGKGRGLAEVAGWRSVGGHRYGIHLRTFIPEGKAFWRSSISTEQCVLWLNKLDVSRGTKRISGSSDVILRLPEARSGCSDEPYPAHQGPRAGSLGYLHSNSGMCVECWKRARRGMEAYSWCCTGQVTKLVLLCTSPAAMQIQRLGKYEPQEQRRIAEIELFACRIGLAGGRASLA
jgi:hypothetical protein